MKVLKEKTNLIEQLNKLRNQYTNKNIEYKRKKCKLLLETDFVQELDKSRPTVDEKNAYVDLQTIELRTEKELLYNKIKHIEMKIELCDDKMRL